MTAHTKGIFILGGLLALVNIGGGLLIGPANTCFSLLAFLLVVVIGGFLQGRAQPGGRVGWSGGLTGAVLGVVNLISQSIGTVLFGLLVMGVMSLANQQSTLDLTGLTQGANLGVGVLGSLLILKGLCFVAGGAGLGALAARIAMPRK
jgi:hypothetical protein